MRTQIGIIGAGPAGLFLSHLLHREGIESVVLESHTREYIESRVRAGVLEQGTTDLMMATGVGERMRREGLVHEGVEIRFGEGRHLRIDFKALTGRGIVVYAQQEVIKDLVAARMAAGGEIVFGAEAVAVEDVEGEKPRIRYRKDGVEHSIECDFIAGCDGFHGVARASVPEKVLAIYERVYPFGWLGILAQTRPASEELIYANHERGFALMSMRSPEVSRLYVQCSPEENLAEWPDARIWEELHLRLGLGERLKEGPVLQKNVAPMRSFVAEPMRFGKLFLAGDAAHIVPATGAKGLNMAVTDVRVLAKGLKEFYSKGRTDLLDRYSEICLRHCWKVQRFSWWMTSVLHRFPEDNAFDRRRQLAELDYLAGSRAAQQSLAENYVGLGVDGLDADGLDV
ncbi:MAG TPA: 4-hydroxybenzoate 3-monooxygenase [Bryobacteraceae bacterium]